MLAQKTKLAEQQVLAKAAVASIDQESSPIEKEFSTEEAEQVRSSQAFTDYIAAKTEYRTEHAAFVAAAEQAVARRREAKGLDERFGQLTAQAQTETDPAARQQLETDAETAREQRDAATAEAEQLETEASNRQKRAQQRRERALADLLALEQEQYLNILALETQDQKAGNIQYAALAEPPAEFGDGGNAVANNSGSTLPANSGTNTATDGDNSATDTNSNTNGDAGTDATSTDPLADNLSLIHI